MIDPKHCYIGASFSALVASIGVVIFIEDPTIRVIFVSLCVVSFVFLCVFSCRVLTATPTHIVIQRQDLLPSPRLVSVYTVPSRVKYFPWEKNYLPKKPGQVLPI